MNNNKQKVSIPQKQNTNPFQNQSNSKYRTSVNNRGTTKNFTRKNGK